MSNLLPKQGSDNGYAGQEASREFDTSKMADQSTHQQTSGLGYYSDVSTGNRTRKSRGQKKLLAIATGGIVL